MQCLTKEKVGLFMLMGGVPGLLKRGYPVLLKAGSTSPASENLLALHIPGLLPRPPEAASPGLELGIYSL
jgi:hypothetical protein